MKVKKAFALITTLVMLISMTGVLPVAAASLPYSSTGVTQTYIVLYKKNAVPSNAASSVSKAGGTLVYSYKQIGVLIASSDNAAFSANLLKDTNVQGAAATTGFATQLDLDSSEERPRQEAIRSPACNGIWIRSTFQKHMSSMAGVLPSLSVTLIPDWITHILIWLRTLILPTVFPA